VKVAEGTIYTATVEQLIREVSEWWRESPVCCLHQMIPDPDIASDGIFRFNGHPLKLGCGSTSVWITDT
jgi:hypothetical protein